MLLLPLGRKWEMTWCQVCSFLSLLLCLTVIPMSYGSRALNNKIPRTGITHNGNIGGTNYPLVLQSIGSQRVTDYWVVDWTELNYTLLIILPKSWDDNQLCPGKSILIIQKLSKNFIPIWLLMLLLWPFTYVTGSR